LILGNFLFPADGISTYAFATVSYIVLVYLGPAAAATGIYF